LKSQLRAALTIMVMCILALPAGCAGKQAGYRPAPPPGPAQSVLALVVYYPKLTQTDAYLVREVHMVQLPAGAAADPKLAAVEELIGGSSQTPGAFRILPKDTRVLSVKTANGLATVDFSRDVLNANAGAALEALGIQSIVYTLTEFPDVQKVSFTVEGTLDQRSRDWWGHVGLYEQPFTRDISTPSIVREPVIWVTSPQPGTKISSPLKVTGSAMVFEAVVNLRLVTADGHVLAESHVMASAGAPGRGDYTASLSFAPPAQGNGFLETFWISPKDGSELDKTRVPVEF